MVKKYFSFAFVLVFILLLFSPVMETYAADPEPWVITVDDFSDAPDYVHNSVCSTVSPFEESPVCTLRAAIDEANKCPADAGACELGVIISLPPGTYTLTIPPVDPNDNSTGSLDIYPLEALPFFVIEGTDPANPPVIDGNGLDRVFRIDNSETYITLRNLIIRGGSLTISESDHLDKNGAGISNRGRLFLEDVIIEDNHINCFPSTFSECYTGVGGGLYSNNQVIMNTSTLRNNSAIRGGGLFHTGGSQFRITHSTISGNEAVSSSGGISNHGLLVMQNSTVSDNVSSSVGGIWNDHIMNLYNVTIASNVSTGGEVANLYNTIEDTLTISNSIIAYPISLYTSPVNCGKYGTWTATGKNLYSDTSCGTGANILSNTDPKLTPLAMLSGATMTRGLLEGSPAHDAVAGFCSDYRGYTLTIDQRGANRDSLCDLGAFEGVAYGVYLPVLHR